MISDRTLLFDEDYPVFLNSYGEADVILFGFQDGNPIKCITELRDWPLSSINIISPISFEEKYSIDKCIIDWDYHINVNDFDLTLRGRKYKSIRYHLRNADKQDFHIKIGNKFTRNHLYILSRHMARHKLDVWDYEELLSLERFFKEHKHGKMMEVYHNDLLVGFDVIDFFEDNKIMVVPLGIYLNIPTITDFLMYENLKFAKENGYELLDIGLTCGSVGLKDFKEKWFAKPKFKIYIQSLNIKSKKE